MNLDGKTVTHRAFGKGAVSGVVDGIITVDFKKDGEKRFFYPGAFETFLTFGDKKLQEKVEDVLHAERQEAEEALAAARREQERLDQLRNFKVTPNAQAVFSCTTDEGAKALENWQVFTGAYLSGASKGCPRVPSRLKPNSACLLTACPDGDESKRVITGVFMVRDDFFGDYCTDGLIAAHEKHRLALEDKEKKPFWSFFPKEEQLAKWGSTEFKYLPNTVMQEIIYNLKKGVRDTARQASATELYEYFCKINHLAPLKEERV